ncbi:HisA/HisF-related TIM barrel protein [Methylibium sp.]|uniref:HisA/HisF-related TIM barrel protein n=1 Tax=Methylibium sp. TaxID=2067992 RepID=UPI0017FCC48B|nr:HisA/HisF-related TIM barrel protein [Methylibium sp.]MBA3590990.1 nickel transporter [Methylibium sp.]
MNIVPVIDLLHGQVVRGVRGDRAQYRPIVSALAGSAEPLAVADRLCEHCATDLLYVADLDALQGRPVQVAVLAGLLRARPTLNLWLDIGLAGRDALEALFAALGTASSRVAPVLASESIASKAELSRCLALAPDALLSLDRRGPAVLDPAGLWDAPALWPQRVIVMTLDRVGADAGPDLATLAAVRARAPEATLIGAGGIRGEADLSAAAQAGAKAWLVASALHDGRIGVVPAVDREPRHYTPLSKALPHATSEAARHRLSRRRAP